MALVVKVKGIKTLIAAFAKIPEMAHKNMGRAMGEAGNAIEEHSATHHRYKTRYGFADEAYDTKVFKNGMGVEVALDGTKGAPYIFSLHNGHKAFRVTPKNGKALHWVSGGKKWYSKGHTIPAYAGERFLDKALVAQTNHCTEIIEAAIEKTLKEAGF